MGKHHEEKSRIMQKYLESIAVNCRCYIEEEIPKKKIDNAIKKFAPDVDRASIIGFLDTTVMENGKNGCIFTDDKMYYLDLLEKPKKFWYDDIMEISITNTHKKDRERSIEITKYDGEKITFNSPFIKKTPLKKFLEIMKDYDSSVQQAEQSVENVKGDNIGARAGGLGVGTFQTVNNQYGEEKFHARRSHSLSAALHNG